MIDFIQNNPYRLLGVYTTSSKKEMVANQGKMKAFLKVGKPVIFPLDLPKTLLAANRTTENVTDADSKLTLPNEQLKYAQFWFAKTTPIDDIAFNHLMAGDIHNAISIWEKKENVSSLQNRIVCALIMEDYAMAISCSEKLYSIYSVDFTKMILGEDTTVSVVNVANNFIDVLCSELDIKQVLSHISNPDWKEYIHSKAINPLITTIQLAIDVSKVSKGKGAQSRLAAGTKLMNDTINDLKQLKIFITSSDLQYQMIADKLGIEILQCGIDFFNDSDNPDAAHKAMKLQSYALSVVVGKMAKDRCKENINILNNIIKDLPPKEVFAEDKTIRKELDRYNEYPNLIKNAIELIKKCVPHLVVIKEKLGKDNSYYIKLSTLIVNISLHNIIEEVNSVQNNELSILRTQLDSYLLMAKLSRVVSEAWHATLYLDQFDMDYAFRIDRYNSNREILQTLKNQLNITGNFSISDVNFRTEGETFNLCKTIQDYKNYCSLYPQGKFIDNAKQKLAFLKAEAEAKAEDNFYKECVSIQDYKNYCSHYPQGKFIDNAKQKLAFLKAKAEDDFYKECVSIQDYKNYCSRYPQGKFIGNAKQKIAYLKEINTIFIFVFVVIAAIIILSIIVK